MADRILQPGEFFEPDSSLASTYRKIEDITQARLGTRAETARQEGQRRAFAGEGGTLADAATVQARQQRLLGDIKTMGQAVDASTKYFNDTGDLEGSNQILSTIHAESDAMKRLAGGPLQILGKEAGLTWVAGELKIPFTDPKTGQKYEPGTNLRYGHDEQGNIKAVLPFGEEEAAGKTGAARVKEFGVQIDSQIERILSSPQYSHDEAGNVLATLEEKMAYLNRLSTQGQVIEDEEGEKRTIQNLQAQDDMQAINGLIQTGERLLQREVGGAFVGSGGDQLRATPRGERPSILDQGRIKTGGEVQPSLASTPSATAMTQDQVFLELQQRAAQGDAQAIEALDAMQRRRGQ